MDYNNKMYRYKISNAEKEIHEKGTKTTKIFREEISIDEIKRWVVDYNVKVREPFSEYFYFYTTEHFVVHYPKLFGIVEIVEI